MFLWIWAVIPVAIMHHCEILPFTSPHAHFGEWTAVQPLSALGCHRPGQGVEEGVAYCSLLSARFPPPLQIDFVPADPRPEPIYIAVTRGSLQPGRLGGILQHYAETADCATPVSWEVLLSDWFS